MSDRDGIVRPSSVPAEGEVEPFDAGWDSHAMGLARATVELVSAEPRWALLGYDCRAQLATGLARLGDEAE